MPAGDCVFACGARDFVQLQDGGERLGTLVNDGRVRLAGNIGLLPCIAPAMRVAKAAWDRCAHGRVTHTVWPALGCVAHGL
jgi:hypothetical protein